MVGCRVQVNLEAIMCPRSSQRDRVPSAMSLSELADLCSTEIDHYRRSEPYNEQYCLEIFHRALLRHDPAAWERLQELFNPIVRGWMHKHPRQNIACYHEPVEYYVAHTFTRVWRSSIHNTLEFETLSSALRYLKLSLQGVVIDTLRVHSQPNEAPSTDSGSGPFAYSIGGPASKEGYGSGEMWVSIKCLLANERERRLAYLFYHCSLKPQEIVRNYQKEFSDTQEIYQLTRNIIESLTGHV